MRSTPWKHPELKPGEVLIGNMTHSQFRKVQSVLISIRKGKVAFKNGEPIRENCVGWRKLYPVFGSENDRVMYDRMWRRG